MEQAPKLTFNNLLLLIDEARSAEICRDTVSLQNILSPIWGNIDQKPELDDFDLTVKAELLRLCGVFLNFYGFQKSIENYQERGKDLLTEALEIFEQKGLHDKAAEANITLAYCYWNAGQILEAETILDISEVTFDDDPLHPIYLQIRLNRLLILFAKDDLEAAINLIEELHPAMEFCHDKRLQTMFHNQAGIFYTNKKLFEKAVFHLYEAIRIAEKANYKLFVAINFNNLSFLYKERGLFETAFVCISESINRLQEISHFGFLSHALDTKAQIQLDSDDQDAALETINQALELFNKGEDYRGLCESLWTKIKILLSQNRLKPALMVFGQLENIAHNKISEKAAELYSENLSKELYAIRDLPLSEEIAEFKKNRVSRALQKADGVIIKAAQFLKLRNHQALSEILNNQFPTLYSELGYRRRATRRRKKEAPPRVFYLDAKSIREEKEINLLDLEGKSLAFDFYLNTEKYQTFYFDKYFMQSFGINAPAVVAVVPVAEFKMGMTVLVYNNDIFTLAKTEYEIYSGIYFVIDPDNGEWVPLKKENVLGEPIGFCTLDKTDSKFIKFSRLVPS